MKLPYKTTEEVRQTFLNHFLNRDYQLIEPSRIIPKDDPTLMFINSRAWLRPFPKIEFLNLIEEHKEISRLPKK